MSARQHNTGRGRGGRGAVNPAAQGSPGGRGGQGGQEGQALGVALPLPLQGQGQGNVEDAGDGQQAVQAPVAPAAGGGGAIQAQLAANLVQGQPLQQGQQPHAIAMQVADGGGQGAGGKAVIRHPGQAPHKPVALSNEILMGLAPATKKSHEEAVAEYVKYMDDIKAWDDQTARLRGSGGPGEVVEVFCGKFVANVANFKPATVQSYLAKFAAVHAIACPRFAGSFMGNNLVPDEMALTASLSEMLRGVGFTSTVQEEANMASLRNVPLFDKNASLPSKLLSILDYSQYVAEDARESPVSLYKFCAVPGADAMTLAAVGLANFETAMTFIGGDVGVKLLEPLRGKVLSVAGGYQVDPDHLNYVFVLGMGTGLRNVSKDYRKLPDNLDSAGKVKKVLEAAVERMVGLMTWADQFQFVSAQPKKRKGHESAEENQPLAPSLRQAQQQRPTRIQQQQQRQQQQPGRSKVNAQLCDAFMFHALSPGKHADCPFGDACKFLHEKGSKAQQEARIKAKKSPTFTEAMRRDLLQKVNN